MDNRASKKFPLGSYIYGRKSSDGMPDRCFNKKKTRDVEYINTGPEEQRVRLLKDDKELNRILENNPNSTDIYRDNFIIRYG